FFPTHSAVAGTLGAFATFAVGFIARPVGGIIAGHLGDRIGRKAILVASLILMGAASTAIGLLPTYESIGVLAVLGLVMLRLLQAWPAGRSGAAPPCSRWSTLLVGCAASSAASPRSVPPPGCCWRPVRSR